MQLDPLLLGEQIIEAAHGANRCPMCLVDQGEGDSMIHVETCSAPIVPDLEAAEILGIPTGAPTP